MISSDFLSIYVVLESLEGVLRSAVCRWHRIATFWSKWQRRLFCCLPVRNWLFITLTIVGFTHVILADWKAPASISSAGTSVAVIEGEKCAYYKPVGDVGRYWLLWSSGTLVFLYKRYHQCKVGTASSLPPPQWPPFGFHVSDGNPRRCRCWSSKGICWCQ